MQISGNTVTNNQVLEIILASRRLPQIHIPIIAPSFG